MYLRNSSRQERKAHLSICADIPTFLNFLNRFLSFSVSLGRSLSGVLFAALVASAVVAGYANFEEVTIVLLVVDILIDDDTGERDHLDMDELLEQVHGADVEDAMLCSPLLELFDPAAAFACCESVLGPARGSERRALPALYEEDMSNVCRTSTAAVVDVERISNNMAKPVKLCVEIVAASVIEQFDWIRKSRSTRKAPPMSMWRASRYGMLCVFNSFLVSICIPFITI